MSRHQLSNNSFSHDTQVQDAMAYLDEQQKEEFLKRFPEWDTLVWSGANVDWHASAIDPDYMSWVTDWLEAETEIYWEDGEPWFPGDEV